MTRHEIDQFDMLQTVDELLTNNQGLFQTQPALVAAHARLHTSVANIFGLAPVQASTNEGDTAAKEQQKQSVIAAFLKVQAGVLAHAAANSDAKLEEEASISESGFKKLRQADMHTWIQKLYGLALPLSASLATWGVAQSDIDALKNGGDGFRQQMRNMVSTKNLSKEATASIKKELKASLDFLGESLDKMMLPYKLLQPAFYAQYTAAREIMDRAASHPKEEDKRASASDAVSDK